jgi:hypothetical protein
MLSGCHETAGLLTTKHADDNHTTLVQHFEDSLSRVVNYFILFVICNPAHARIDHSNQITAVAFPMFGV